MGHGPDVSISYALMQTHRCAHILRCGHTRASFVKYFHYLKKWYSRQQAELFLPIIVLFGLKPELTLVEIVEKSLPFKILLLSIIVDSYVCQL